MGNHQSGQVSPTTTASTVVSVLAVVSVALRFWTRRLIKAGYGPDDWWILVGVASMLGTGGILLYGVKADPNGGQDINRDDPNFDYAAHTTYLKTSFAAATLYFSVVTAIKISILYMYRRIFPVDEAFIQSQIVGALVLVWWLVGSVLTIVSCLPFKRFWVGPSVGGYCFDFNIYWMAMGAVELVIDVLLLILPIRMILGLRLSRQQKVLVVGIFGVAGFVIVTGVVRVILGYRPGSQNVAFARAELWSAVHIGTAVVCACLPTLRPLIKEASTTFISLKRKYGSSSNSSKDGSGSGSGESNTGSRNREPSDDPEMRNVRNGSVSIDNSLLMRDDDLPPLTPVQVAPPRMGLRAEDAV